MLKAQPQLLHSIPIHRRPRHLSAGTMTREAPLLHLRSPPLLPPLLTLLLLLLLLFLLSSPAAAGAAGAEENAAAAKLNLQASSVPARGGADAPAKAWLHGSERRVPHASDPLHNR